MTRLFIFLILSCALGCTETSDSPSEAPPAHVVSGETMGTTYTIRLTDLTGGETLESIQVAVDKELATVNQQMSTYIDDSELSRFNTSASADWFPVSPEVVEVVKLALSISEKTNGKYDVTVGPLVNLWNFGPNPMLQEIPTDDEINAALSRVGFEHLSTRENPPALKKSKPDLYVDLSSIAKGHGVDRIASILDAMNIPGYMIEIGGEVRTRGSKADGKFWRIGVENPASKPGDIISIIPLKNQALASSGDYRNFFEVDGVRYTHTIDPTTGRPIVHDTTAVSVIADTCAEADAWATAILVLGANYTDTLSSDQNLGVLLINRVDNGLVLEPNTRFTASQSRSDTAE